MDEMEDKLKYLDEMIEYQGKKLTFEYFLIDRGLMHKSKNIILNKYDNANPEFKKEIEKEYFKWIQYLMDHYFNLLHLKMIYKQTWLPLLRIMKKVSTGQVKFYITKKG